MVLTPPWVLLDTHKKMMDRNLHKEAEGEKAREIQKMMKDKIGGRKPNKPS